MADTKLIDMRETGQNKMSPKKQSILLVIGMMAVFLVMTVIMSLVKDHLTIADETLKADIAHLLAEIATALTSVFAIIIARKTSGCELKSAFKFKKFDWSVPIMLTLFVWSACETTTAIDGAILSRSMSVRPGSENSITVISVICSCLLAPFFEELIFRFSFMGVMKKSFCKRMKIFLPVLIFSYIHLYNIQGFFEVLVGSLVAATIYYYTENIIYVIIEHVAHNSLCLFDFNKVDLFGSSVYSRHNGFVIMNTGYMIINMILLAGCLVWFFKYFKPKYSMKA